LAFAPELAGENEVLKSSHFADLVGREAGSFWFRSRNRFLIWSLQRYFPEAQRFLEIGCGSGFVLSGIRRALPELNLSGSKILTARLAFAAKRLSSVELF